MPVKFLNTRGGALAILHSCETAGCAKPAVFGSEASMVRVIKKINEKDIEGARRAAGKWHCEEHKSTGIK